MPSKLTPDDYHTLAKKRGIIWIADEIINTRTKTRWQCLKGHIWESTYGNIYNGNSCPYCRSSAKRSDQRRQRQEDDYHNLAMQKGYTWLGPFPGSVVRKTNWKCNKGHVFSLSYNMLRQRGCSVCGKIRQNAYKRKTSVDYHALAKERSYIWLGPSKLSIHEKTCWQCPKGHIWEATYGKIYTGRTCPQCKDLINGQRVSTPQRYIAEKVGGIINHKVGKYHIDVALISDNHNIVIEYDCWYWHKDQLDKDKKRDRYLLKQGWSIIHVRANFDWPTKEQLLQAIQEVKSGSRYVEIVLDWGER